MLEASIGPRPSGLMPEQTEELMKRIRQAVADAGIVQGPNQSLAEVFAKAGGMSTRELEDYLVRRSRSPK